MNSYAVARAYLLSLIFGGASLLSLLMATDIARGDFYNWTVGTVGFVLATLLLGTLISPLFFVAIVTIRRHGWARPWSDAMTAALLMFLTLLALPPFETPVALGEWGWFVVCLEGAFIGLWMGTLYWFLCGKPSSDDG